MTVAVDLANCSAAELLQCYRSGAASPVEATEAVLARIAARNAELKAFCLVDAAHVCFASGSTRLVCFA